jgi:2',3'-cyclic-nucleotide 2'-phosphodiesterase (5'-nucleotidase family)
VAEHLVETGVDAVGMGPTDLSIGWEHFQRIASEQGLPFLAANISCAETQPYPATRVVERGGVTLGFVGAYLGALPEDAEGCSASEPVPAVTAAVASLEGVDAVVVLGAWDAKNAEALAAAVPAVDFIVTASNLTLPDGRALTRDDWLLGSGSRGKKIGVLEATLVPGGEGWQGASPGAELAKRIDSYRKRLSSNQERLETAADDRAKQRAERQITFYNKEIERLETELAAATAPRERPANTFEHSLADLGKDVAAHEATLAKVQACNALLEEKGLVVEKKPPERVDLPMGIPGVRRPAGGTDGAAPPRLELKGAPLVQPKGAPEVAPDVPVVAPKAE